MDIKMTIEIRAIAFLDILGFKDLIKKVEKGDQEARRQFNGFRTVVDAFVSFDNETLSNLMPTHLQPQYIFVSDSIIISAPLQDPAGYDGLVTVTLKAIQLTHKLLEFGLSIRGGIAVGKVLQDPKNIFGSGYVEAIDVEKKADYPRILLSDDAVSHLDRAIHLNLPLGELPLWINDRGQRIVNTFHPWYINGIEQHGRIELAFNNYRIHIFENLGKYECHPKIKAKWNWLAQSFNNALEAHQISVDRIEIPKTF